MPSTGMGPRQGRGERSGEPFQEAELSAVVEPYLHEWQTQPLLRENGAAAHYAARLAELAAIVPAEILASVLPDPSLRPLLAAAIVHELSDIGIEPAQITRQALINHSPILSILNLPYRPTFIADVIEELRDSIAEGARSIDAERLQEILLDKGGINSTLRNLLLANRLNATVLRKTSYRAKIALAQYSWRESNAKVSSYDPPELPTGELDNECVKFVVALTSESEPFPDSYMDYGQNEGEERYGLHATGEGLGSIVGRPPPHTLIDPENVEQLFAGLREVGVSQARPGEREAIRRMGVHRRMVKRLFDFIDTPEGGSFPGIVASVSSLNELQLQSVLQWSRLVEEMVRFSVTEVGDQQLRLGSGMIFTPLRGLHARIESSQPSTRTVTAAADAMRALGIEVDIAGRTSRDKGESAVSEGVTLATHQIDVVLRRDKEFEREAQELRPLDDSLPARVSLGGNEHHPTQTLAEIKALMEHFEVFDFSIESLRQATAADPPTIVFIGRTDQKRADKALISFIRERLPEWKVRVLVPFEADIPKLPSAIGANYSVEVIPDLRDQPTLLEKTRGAAVVYVSNAEATSNVEQKGAGDGKRVSPHYLTASVMDQNRLQLMHPLPASGELEDAVFVHPRSLIRAVMANKIYVIASLVAHQLIARRARESKAGVEYV